MLLDDRKFSPAEEVETEFPRTPKWARRVREAEKRGYFTGTEADPKHYTGMYYHCQAPGTDALEFMSYRTCLVGEARGWTAGRYTPRQTTAAEARVSYLLATALTNNNFADAYEALRLAQKL